MDRSRYCLDHLGDNDLLAGITRLAADDHARLADLLAHLAQVDARKLYVGLAYPSLFAYCVAALGYSEDETYKRIQAARAAHAYPLLFELVAKGELHLSAINLLAPHLTPDNHQALLQAACHKSKREVEQLVAARFPRPDVATSLRQLPTPAVAASSPAAPLLAAAPTSSPAPARKAAAAMLQKRAEVAPAASTLGPAAPARLAGERQPAAALTPLSAERYRLQLTLGRDTRDKLLRAQALMRHRLPSGDLSAVLDQALELLLAKLETRKFGKRRSAPTPSPAPQPLGPANATSTNHHGAAALPKAQVAATPAMSREDNRTAAAPASTTPESQVVAPAPAQVAPLCAAPQDQALASRPAPACQTQSADELAAANTGRATRYVPNAVRRAVAERDGYRCTFVAPDGRRCQAEAQLEFHHDQPFARGGLSTIGGLRLLCRVHNDYHAQLDFGAAHMMAAKKRKPPVRKQGETGPRLSA